MEVVRCFTGGTRRASCGLRPVRKLKVEDKEVKPKVLLLLADSLGDYRACDGSPGDFLVEYKTPKP